jgi:ribosomal protein S18 acetylase RimI-like enzyme
MIQIKTATEQDAELIANISRETFYKTFAEHNTQTDMDKFMSEQFSKEKLMAEVGAGGNTFLLAYVDDEPAGYVFLKEGSHKNLATNNAIEISRLYALNSFIGKGIGKALMQSAIELAKAQNKETIWLGVWEHNQRAIQFYQSFNFQKFDEHDFILGNDVQRDWLMQLLIKNY